MEKAQDRYRYSGESLSDLVTGFRTRENVSQSFVAELVGVDHSFISRLENGTRTTMSAELAVDLATLLTNSASEAMPFLLVASGIPPHLVHRCIMSYTEEILAEYRAQESPSAPHFILSEGVDAILPQESSRQYVNEMNNKTIPSNEPVITEQEPEDPYSLASILPAASFVRSQPKFSYETIAESLYKSIKVGEYTDLLPPEGELCRLFNVSRGTVRQGLRLLKERGLIQPMQGVGTVIVHGAGAKRSSHR